MKDLIASRFAAGSFVAVALMFWLGWVFLPVRIGAYLEPIVFGQIHEHFHFWIWMYRLHFLSMIVTVITISAQVADSPSRVLLFRKWLNLPLTSLRASSQS